MKVLITGGLGFVGSHISNRFSDKGYEVVILDNDGHTSCINRIDKAKYNYPTILIGDIQDSSIYDKLDTFKTVSGGDHKASKMFLVNLPKLFSSDVIKAFKELEDDDK